MLSRAQQICSLICVIVAMSVTGLTPSIVKASSPALSIILPRGIQRGTEQVLNFHGDRLSDVEEVMFYDPSSLEVKNIEVVNEKHLKITINVAPDCKLGERVVQLRAKSGISEFRTFWVEAYPAVDEAEPNGSLEEANSVAMNHVVSGVVDREDIDYFVVEAEKGQRITAEVVAIRLGSFLFDPHVSILDEKRFELSADDDTPLAMQDAVASIVAPEAGKYYVVIRESSYGGNGNCRYRLNIGTFPRPTAVYPAGGKVGETLQLTYLGDAAGPKTEDFVVPTDAKSEISLFPQDEQGIAPSPLQFRATQFDNLLEAEPNNGFDNATPGVSTNAFNGRIETPGDVDFFKFTATKGQVFDVECYARRLRSGLDPVMNIYNAKRGGVAGNDDSRGPDSYIRFTAPEDGEYYIRVTDHLQRGQEDFVYRIELQPATPQLSISIPRVDRYSQTRQSIYIPKGNRFATLVTASRANFGGEIVLDDSQLPEGVTMHAKPMMANLNIMPVVFEATEEAQIGGYLMDWIGKHVDPNTGITGHFNNTGSMVLGPPNNQDYYPLVVDQVAVAIVDHVPFKLEIVQPQAPLVRNGVMNLKVVAHRDEGFNQPIRIQFPFRPPGVGAGSAINIPADQTEVIYQLNANGNAQLADWPVYVIGQANSNGTAWVASQLANLTVAEPYASCALSRTSVEQGAATQMVATFTQTNPFEGEAKAELIGLPAKVTCEPLMITKDTTEVVFNIQTAPDSPVGKHGVYVQLTVTQNGEPVVARAGGNEMQIVTPPPAPKQEEKPAEAKPTPKPEEKPAEKPLSRLEKLRLEAQKAREGKTD